MRLASSTAVVSSEARYICVVASESCPMPSLITDRGTWRWRAALAQEWRATYIVSGRGRRSSSLSCFSRWFTTCRALVYCRRSSPSLLMMGSR